MPDLTQAVRVSELALEPYRMRVQPIASGPGADWFGPSVPMPPGAPKEVAGRQWDFPPGFNLQTRPRAYEPIGFWELRALADNYDLIRLFQIAYNAQFTNNASSAVTIVWRVTYQGVAVLDSAGITVNPGVTATVAKQTTYTPGAQSGVFAFIADMVSGVSPAATASYVDLSVTELRR